MKHKPKILIVEDDPHNHQLYRTAFEKGGFTVVMLENADGYFPEEVSRIAPDIISMDIMLAKNGGEADRNGLEGIEKLKSDLRTHTIPVMVMTNFFEENKVKKAKELGAVDFIFLPGHVFSKIPVLFLRYLENPKKYKASHPLFREA